MAWMVGRATWRRSLPPWTGCGGARVCRRWMFGGRPPVDPCWVAGQSRRESNPHRPVLETGALLVELLPFDDSCCRVGADPVVSAPRPGFGSVGLVALVGLSGAALGFVDSGGGPPKRRPGRVDQDPLRGALLIGVLVVPGVGDHRADDQHPVPLAEGVSDVLAEGAEGGAGVPGRLVIGPFACVGVAAAAVDQHREPDQLLAGRCEGDLE